MDLDTTELDLVEPMRWFDGYRSERRELDAEPDGLVPAGRAGRGRHRVLSRGSALLTGLLAAVVLMVMLYVDRPFDTDAGSDAGRIVSAPLDARRELEFHLVTGVKTATIRSGDLSDRLYLITTGPKGDAEPNVANEATKVALSLVPTGADLPATVDIQLSSKVRWKLNLGGGAVEYRIDLRAGPIAGLDIGGGATKIEMSLPTPTGTVPVRMTGGANQLLVHAPTGVPARVRLGNGATTVNLDAFARSSVAPGTVFTPNGWQAATARYDIDAAAGVATLRLDRLASTTPATAG
jgi:hypothetical protein